MRSNTTVADYPEVAEQWHSTKNGNLQPKNACFRSNKKVWWKCPIADDHEWMASPNARTRGHKCPYCCGNKTVLSNCLATTHPEVAAQWHPTKNGELTPKNVTAGSSKKIWWRCSLGHSWETSISHRTHGRKCPYCSNKKVNDSNCLTTTHPEIASQWHPTKNGNLTPSVVVAGSNKKVWWKCPVAADHEWTTTVSKRTLDGCGCPCCSMPAKKAALSNCLAATHPELAKRWHPTKNGELTPYCVTAGSDKQVWWKCSLNHEWKASIGNRARDRGCPQCSESKGERAVADYLTSKNISHHRQKTFPSCKNKRSLRFDFVIKHNGKFAIIEYQGMQHYQPVNFGGYIKENFQKTKKHDQIKKEWCRQNNVLLLEIPYWEYHNIGNVVGNFLNKM